MIYRLPALHTADNNVMHCYQLESAFVKKDTMTSNIIYNLAKSFCIFVLCCIVLYCIVCLLFGLLSTRKWVPASASVLHVWLGSKIRARIYCSLTVFSDRTSIWAENDTWCASHKQCIHGHSMSSALAPPHPRWLYGLVICHVHHTDEKYGCNDDRPTSAINLVIQNGSGVVYSF